MGSTLRVLHSVIMTCFIPVFLLITSLFWLHRTKGSVSKWAASHEREQCKVLRVWFNNTLQRGLTRLCFHDSLHTYIPRNDCIFLYCLPSKNKEFCCLNALHLYFVLTLWYRWEASFSCSFLLSCLHHSDDR